MIPSTRTRRKFHRWILKNGGRVLERKQNEYTRFAACDQLCIIFQKGTGHLGAMQGDDTAEAWQAFQAGRDMDLTSETEVAEGPRQYKARVSVALAAADIRSGRCEPLSLRTLARSLRLPVRLVARVAKANGCTVSRFKIVRSSAR